jgi:rod shape-determining protein MreD
MFAGQRESSWLVYVTSLVALMLTVLPLPQLISVVWPNFLVVVILYWSTMTPRAGGMLLGFLGGIALDVLNGTQLGQHALALSLVTYLALRLHQISRAKPMFEQSLLTFGALLLYETTLWAIDGFSNQGTGNWTRWLHIPLGALCWPPIAGVLGRLHAPR